MKKLGKVYWICGLAGSGKTTIAEQFSKKLKLKGFTLFYLMEITLEKVLIYLKIFLMKVD